MRYAEERRIFYVALTRIKNTIQVVVPKRNPSVFIQELLDDGVLIDKLIEEEVICPKCEGIMVVRDKGFYGCSNYPLCDHTVDIETDLNKRCRVCNDYLVKRKSRHGMFYGCNSYKYYLDNIKQGCHYTESI